jgi:hypothetical protein
LSAKLWPFSASMGKMGRTRAYTRILPCARVSVCV